MRTRALLAFFVGAPLLASCGDDGSAAEGETGGADTTGRDTDPSSATESQDDSDESTGLDETGEETQGGCTPQDECMANEDCAEGQTCILANCTCFGDPIEPECRFEGTGVYADCVTDGNAACMGGAGTSCLVDDVGTPTAGVCFFSCEQACDCPAPPEGFDDQVACVDLTGDMTRDCYISCENGQSCPDGMFCFFGTVCFHGESMGIPPYGDCVNESGQCADGICLVDDTNDPNEGACAPFCMDDSDCPAADSGDAEPACLDFGNFDACLLDCSDGEDCPDDMICVSLGGGFSACTWELETEDPPELEYSDCANNPPETCDTDETCLAASENDDAWAVCSQTGCTDENDCPEAPEGGTAAVACQEIGEDHVCVLDCSNDGDGCPNGMECTPDGFCAWPDAGYLLLEDFYYGQLRPGWTVVDVDGFTPAPQTSFVTEAWVVSDTIVGDYAAVSTSWYDPEDQADDWLITPPIMLGEASVLSWRAVSPANPGFRDGYEVRVSTSGTDIADFMTDDPIFELDEEEATYTNRMVDLAAEGYANEQVWIAFRNNSDDKFLLFVDDVSVSQ